MSTVTKPRGISSDTHVFGSQTDGAVYIQRGSTSSRQVSLAFFAAGLATFAVLYCVQPVFPVFTARFHVSPAMASLSLSMTTALLAVSLPVAGAISDAIGRKGVMSTALVGSSICCVLSTLSPNFASLIILRTIQGIALAGLPAVAMAYLSEEMEAQSLGWAMGLYISGNSIGGLLGRIVVSSVTDLTDSWRIGIGVISLISLFATWYFWRHLPESNHFEPRVIAPKTLLRSFAVQFRDPGLVSLYAQGALLMGSFVSLYNYTGFRLMEAPYRLSQSVVGLIFIVYLVGTFSSSWMGKLADEFGRRKVLWLNVAIMGAGVLLTLTPNLIVIILGTALFTFGFFGGHSTASSWVGRRAVFGKGQASALYLLFYYVGSSVGGTSGGVFWTHYHWAGLVAMVGALLVAALFVSLILSRIPPLQQNTP